MGGDKPTKQKDIEKAKKLEQNKRYLVWKPQNLT